MASQLVFIVYHFLSIDHTSSLQVYPSGVCRYWKCGAVRLDTLELRVGTAKKKTVPVYYKASVRCYPEQCFINTDAKCTTRFEKAV